MKYKVLLTGKNTGLIDDFFRGLDEKFVFQTTSDRLGDIREHFNSFLPDIFLYCPDKDSAKSMENIAFAKQTAGDRQIPMAVVGDSEELDYFNQIAPQTADLQLSKTLSAELIRIRLMKYLDSKSEESIPEFVLPEPEPEEENDADIPDILATLQRMENGEELEGKVQERKHILVVDDDVRMLKVLKEYLHGEYEVATAVSGKIALRFLTNKKTDLILLDYEMPGEDGPAVLAKLQADERTKDIPVIFLTGITKKEKIEKALVMKPQGYLLKPVNRKKLMSTIERVFYGG